MSRILTLREPELEPTKGTERRRGSTAESEEFTNLQALREKVHKTVHEISSPLQSTICFLHLVRYRLKADDGELTRQVNEVISQITQINHQLRTITSHVDVAAEMRRSSGNPLSGQEAQLDLGLR